MRNWGRLAAEVAPLAAPILLMLREAAAADPELAETLQKTDRQRLTRMRRNARSLAERDFLRAGVTARQAADIMWALTSPDFYQLLVVRRGWTPAAFGELIGRALAGALL